MKMEQPRHREAPEPGPAETGRGGGGLPTAAREEARWPGVALALGLVVNGLWVGALLWLVARWIGVV